MCAVKAVEKAIRKDMRDIGDNLRALKTPEWAKWMKRWRGGGSGMTEVFGDGTEQEVVPQLAFAAHLGEEGAIGGSFKNSSYYIPTSSKQSKRESSYSIHTVRCSVQTHPLGMCHACKLHLPPTIYPSPLSQHAPWLGKATEAPNQRGMGLKLRRVSQIHNMYGVRNTTMERNIVVRSLP